MNERERVTACAQVCEYEERARQTESLRENARAKARERRREGHAHTHARTCTLERERASKKVRVLEIE